MDALSGLGGRLAELLAEAPDDPFVLIGAMLLAWLPVCAFLLGALALLASLQHHLVHRRRPRLGFELPPPARRPLVTRRFISSPRQTNGPLAAARLAVAVAVVLGFSAVILASSGPLLVAALHG
jgi:hypothetical protein